MVEFHSQARVNLIEFAAGENLIEVARKVEEPLGADDDELDRHEPARPYRRRQRSRPGPGQRKRPRQGPLGTRQEPAADPLELGLGRSRVEQVLGRRAVPGLGLAQYAPDDVSRRLAADVVGLDHLHRNADQPEQERREQARPVLPADSMEEHAAVRRGEDADGLGEAGGVELERLAVQRPVLLGDVEA